MKSQFFPLYAVLFGAYVGVSLPLPLMGPMILGAESPFTFAFEYRFLILGISLAAFPIGNFFGAPLLGALSDRIGKKTVLLVTLSGGAACYALSGFAIASGNIWLFIASRAVCGLFEGNAAIGQSYIAAHSKAHERLRVFGVMIAVISLGYVAGPIVSGVFSNRALISMASFHLPFFVVSAFIGLTIIFIAIYFRDDAVVQEKPTSVLTQIIELPRHGIFMKLLCISLLASMARGLFLEFLSSFLNLRFSVTVADSTWLFVFIAFVWGGTGLLMHKGHAVSEGKKLIAALFASCLTLAWISQSQQVLAIFILSIPLTVGLAANSTLISSLASQMVEPSRLGFCMGVLASTNIFAECIICMLGGPGMNYSEDVPFVCGAILLCIAGFLFVKWNRLERVHTV